VIRVLSKKGQTVLLAIDAPKDVVISRCTEKKEVGGKETSE
jgi:sRNA-binding carbon storage regulator CsrA